MVTTTTTYSFKKPTVADDEDVWGGYLNETIDLIDDVLDGTTPVTGIDINSGTIDNVVIGGTTAAAGSFTSVTIEGSNVVFEGATADDFETTLTVVDPTADRTISLPDADGTVLLQASDKSVTIDASTANNSKLLIEADNIDFVDSWTINVDPSASTSGSYLNIAIDNDAKASFYTNEIRFNEDVLLNGNLIFEGATADTYETTLTVTDPTADRTITFPDATGNIAVFSTAPTSAITDGTNGQVLTTDGSGGLSFADAGGGNTFDSSIIFEGATADDFETTLTVTDPTADNTITLPDESGTVALIDSSGHLIVENDDPELQLISTDTDESFLKLRKNLASDAWDMQIDGSNAETGSSFEIAIDGSSVSSQNVTSGVSKTIIKDLLQVQGQDAVNDDANLEVNGFFGAAELSVYSGGSTSKIGIGTQTPAVSLDIATTDAIQVPDGTTAQRPASPANGMFRYSTTDNQFEGYINGSWGAVGGGGGGASDAVEVTESSGTYTLDLSAGNNFYANNTGAYTYALSNIPSTAFVGRYEFSYDGGNITWPTEFSWDGGSAPDFAPVRDYVIEFSKIKSSSSVKAIKHGTFDYTGSTTFPTFIGSQEGGSANGSAFSITLNSGLTGGTASAVSSGDVGLLIIVEETNSSVPATPSGWTSQFSGQANDSFDTRVKVCTRVMDGTETTVSMAATGDTSSSHCAIVFVFSGIDNTTPIDATIQSVTTTNTAIASSMPTITSSSEDVGKILIGAHCAGHAQGSFTDFPDTTGDYNFFRHVAFNDGGDSSLAMGFQPFKSASADQTPPYITWPKNTASTYSNMTLAIALRGTS